ncbi:hypothetical protein PIB30_071417 [Stylosanthes scabra]|uniref:Uncharacterized protein n=1 Tax=Stylosanthes scabra TaxID=79078 RepID=A0ABU6QP61_9FABA|nr:hypothetical protein [Stylosanthes scabra]
MIWKSAGIVKFHIRTRTSSATPTIVTMLASTIVKTSLDFFNGPRSKASYSSNGITLPQAPRSHKQSRISTPRILQHGGFLHSWVEEHLVEDRFVKYVVAGILGFVFLGLAGGIGFVVSVEVSFIGSVGYHATLGAVHNTVCRWVAIVGFHKNCGMP